MNNIRQLFNIHDTAGFRDKQVGRVYSKCGLCPSLLCFSQGGNKQPKIIETDDE